MTDFGHLAHLLRNTAVKDIIRAIERDGFSLDRAGQTGARIYRHSDGRRVVIFPSAEFSDVPLLPQMHSPGYICFQHRVINSDGEKYQPALTAFPL